MRTAGLALTAVLVLAGCGGGDGDPATAAVARACLTKEQRAQRSTSATNDNSKAFRGTIERHGKLTIVWVRGKDSNEADRIKGCIL